MNPEIFILTHDNNLIRSIERFLKYTHVNNKKSIHILCGTGKASDNEIAVLKLYRRIADEIEEHIHDKNETYRLKSAIAIVDEVVLLDQFNPVQGNSWSTVIAMLVLTFPEIHWVFISPYLPSFDFRLLHSLTYSNLWDILKLNSDILKLHDEEFTPLLDPTGLRSLIRQQTKKIDGGKATPFFPVREQSAAAIDEEESYAYLNAYEAYRFGFRSHVVTSYSMMEKLFKQEFFKLNPQLVFEDLYLSFPDRTYKGSLSNLEERDNHFYKLKDVRYRILITVGHRRAVEPERWTMNKAHLRSLKLFNGLHYKILFKPFAGVFDLWHKSLLYRWLRQRGYRGLAEDYKWPPKKVPREVEASHSAPGRLLEIAERLIQRGERMLHCAMTVKDSIKVHYLHWKPKNYLETELPRQLWRL